MESMHRNPTTENGRRRRAFLPPHIDGVGKGEGRGEGATVKSRKADIISLTGIVSFPRTWPHGLTGEEGWWWHGQERS
jgi:hypothetical protein